MKTGVVKKSKTSDLLKPIWLMLAGFFVSSMLLSIGWFMTTRSMEKGASEILAVGSLDQTKDALNQKIGALEFGLADNSSGWLSINALVDELEIRSKQINSEFRQNELAAKLQTEVAELKTNISSFQSAKEDAVAALSEIAKLLDINLEQTASATRDLDILITLSNLEEDKREAIQKSLADDIDELTTALISASRLERNLSAIIRSKLSSSDQTPPINSLALSTQGIPEPCLSNANDQNICQPSSIRLYDSITQITSSDEFSDIDLQTALLAVSAYERAGAAALSEKKAELSLSLLETSEARATFSEYIELSDRLSRLTRALVESKTIVVNIGTSRRLPDLDLVNTNFASLLSSIRIRLNVLDALSEVLIGDSVTARGVESAELEEAWLKTSNALDQVEYLSKNTDQLISNVSQISRDMFAQTNDSASTNFSNLILLSGLNTFVVLILSALAIFLSSRFLMAPLTKITDKIFVISRGEIPDKIEETQGGSELNKLREAVNRLIETEKQFRFASEIANLGRWRFSASGRLQLSKKAREIIGIETINEEVSFVSILAKLDPEQKALLQQSWANALETGESFRSLLSLRDQNSEDKSVVLYAEGIANTDGKITGLNGVVQDVTEFAALRAQLIQSQKLDIVGQLTSGVAHDFNNALSIVLGNLELIEDSTKDEFIKRKLRVAIDAATRGADLSRSMLAFARKQPLEPENVDLNEVVEEAANWVRSIFPSRIVISSTVDEKSHFSKLDRSFAQSAVLNLLINARDAITEEGRIEISLNCENITEQDSTSLPAGQYNLIKVKDTGTGIPPNIVEKVFEPFFSTKGTDARSGLGLPMVKGFVEQSGGGVTIQSVEGVGSQFSLYFPATQNLGVPNEILEHSEGDAPSLSTALALLVEDDPSLNNLFAAFLRQINTEVVTAQNGDEALKLWRSDNNFDLVVSDMNMPGTIQGDALLELIKKERPSIATALLTGDVNYERSPASNIGTHHSVLLKPIRKATFQREIVSLLDKSRQTN